MADKQVVPIPPSLQTLLNAVYSYTVNVNNDLHQVLSLCLRRTKHLHGHLVQQARSELQQTAAQCLTGTFSHTFSQLGIMRADILNLFIFTNTMLLVTESHRANLPQNEFNKKRITLLRNTRGLFLEDLSTLLIKCLQLEVKCINVIFRGNIDKRIDTLTNLQNFIISIIHQFDQYNVRTRRDDLMQTLTAIRGIVAKLQNKFIGPINPMDPEFILFSYCRYSFEEAIVAVPNELAAAILCNYNPDLMIKLLARWKAHPQVRFKEKRDLLVSLMPQFSNIKNESTIS